MYPTHLKHKPILVADNYENKDGEYTDCKALSIGEAQWNNEEISAKIWRHTGKRWSRQCEEIPLHRCLDLTILILSAFLKDSETDLSNTYLGEKVHDKTKISKIKKYIEENPDLMQRIGEIKRVLGKYDKV